MNTNPLLMDGKDSEEYRDAMNNLLYRTREYMKSNYHGPFRTCEDAIYPGNETYSVECKTCGAITLVTWDHYIGTTVEMTPLICTQKPLGPEKAPHTHDWFRNYHTNDPSEDTWTCTRCMVTVARNPADGLLPGEVEYHAAFPEAAELIARGELRPYTNLDEQE